MKTKTNNKTQNTPKTKPSAEDKALAKLVRTKFICAIQDMSKLCRENGLSFGIIGWVEDPVERGDAVKKTLKFRCGTANAHAFLKHKVFDICTMLMDYADKGNHNDAAILCKMTERIIRYFCEMFMSQLNKETETDNKSKTKEK